MHSGSSPAGPLACASPAWTMTAAPGPPNTVRPATSSLCGGPTVQPTGRKYRLPMATVGRWENGVMVEEFLYWDNGAFMKQIGLAP